MSRFAGIVTAAVVAASCAPVRPCSPAAYAVVDETCAALVERAESDEDRLRVLVLCDDLFRVQEATCAED